MTKEEIEKAKLLVFKIITENPDQYTAFVTVCARAWSHFEAGHNKKMAGLTSVIWKLISPKKAKEYIDNRKTHGYLNLDMFPELEEELLRISDSANPNNKH